LGYDPRYSKYEYKDKFFKIKHKLIILKNIPFLATNFTNEKEKSFFNMKKNNQIKQKGPKMPIKMLSGIRKKIVKEYEQKQKQNFQENIQYNSSEKYHDLGFLKRKLQEDKSKNTQNFLKNKYKYKDMHSKQLGNFKNGTLTLSKSEIFKISSS